METKKDEILGNKIAVAGATLGGAILSTAIGGTICGIGAVPLLTPIVGGALAYFIARKRHKHKDGDDDDKH